MGEEQLNNSGRPTPAQEITPNWQGRFQWGNGVISMVFQASEDAPVTLVGLSGRGMEPVTVDIAGEPDAQPIVEIRSSRNCGTDNRFGLAVSAEGRRLRFAGAFSFEPDGSGHIGQRRLAIRQVDAESGLTVVTVYDAFAHISAVRCFSVVSCDDPFPMESISALNLTVPLAESGIEEGNVNVYWGDSSWCLEHDWHGVPLRYTALRDRNRVANPGISSTRFVRRSTSTWSTGEYLPEGVLTAGTVEAVNIADAAEINDKATSNGTVSGAETGNNTSGDGKPTQSKPFSLMWQIEHNGPWKWEIRENNPGLSVAAFGPEFEDHQWSTMLGLGNDCFTVTATFAIAAGGWQEAVAEMTMKRRAMREIKAGELGRLAQTEAMQHVVVYNDGMNRRPDPQDAPETELQLLDAAKKAGADVFCIDAGWHNDGDWWDKVGEWEPAMNRFGHLRLAGLVHAIQAAGLRAGLWMEPEVIGVESPMASRLPDSAFFQRHGERVCDRGRFHLDFRSPVACDHATSAVERLIDEFGITYFKFDYNTTPGSGSDYQAESIGAALVDHCRAVQDWVDDLRQAHPDVMFESCAAGAMRADYATLLRFDLQSASDQHDAAAYAGIVAAAGLGVPPEQQGNRAVVQPQMNAEQTTLALAGSILGRLILAGELHEISDEQMALVQSAVKLQRQVTDVQMECVPWWPAEMPSFTDDWLVYGLRHDRQQENNDPPRLAVESEVGGVSNAGETGVTGETGGETGVTGEAGEPDISTDFEHAVDYVTIWRRAGGRSLDVNLGADVMSVEQVFPRADASVEPWSIEMTDTPGVVRFTAATVDGPTARVFAVTRSNS